MSAAQTKTAKGGGHETRTWITQPPFARSQGGQRRWRVERAGAPSGMGYGLGWIAMCYQTGVGQYFTRHTDALAYAFAQTTPPMETPC